MLVRPPLLYEVPPHITESSGSWLQLLGDGTVSEPVVRSEQPSGSSGSSCTRGGLRCTGKSFTCPPLFMAIRCNMYFCWSNLLTWTTLNPFNFLDSLEEFVHFSCFIFYCGILYTVYIVCSLSTCLYSILKTHICPIIYLS